MFSKRVVLSLQRFGVVPRKSTEPVLPSIEPTTAFLRGMFDGDGCLYIDKRGRLSAHFCGHPTLVNWFANAVGITCPSVRLRKRTAYAQWGAHDTAIRLANILYPRGEGPVLERKARIAEVYRGSSSADDGLF